MVQFTVNCDADSVIAEVTVFPSCSVDGVPGTKSATTSAATSAVLSGPAVAIPQGGNAQIQVTLTGTGPWTVSWSDGGSPSSVTPSTFRRTVTPAGTTTYVATVTDSTGCSSVSEPLTITVTPPAPVAVTAVAISATQVQLSWTMPGVADRFEVQRRAPGGSFVSHHITASAATSVILSATANTAYLYRVQAIKSETRSDWSVPDLATTVVFGANLDPADSVVTAADITQLRTAVNAVRALWNHMLAPIAFTDSNLQGAVAKAVHHTELRNALNEARAGLDLPPVPYTTTAPVAGQLIRAADVNDLRGGAR